MSSFKDTVEELLKSAENSVLNNFFESAFGDYDDDGDILFANKLRENNIYQEHVTNFGGEGQGDLYWSVYKFMQGDEILYVQFSGWYASYNGSEYNEWFFVEPKQVTVTEYHQI